MPYLKNNQRCDFVKKEKVTMRDVAEKLNMSLATVSYALNFSDKEKIKHETRIKILETAKDMGYVRSKTSKSIASRKSFLVGIVLCFDEKASINTKTMQFELALKLEKYLDELGYSSVLIHLKNESEIKDYAFSSQFLESYFIIRPKKEQFKALSKMFFTPVVILDGYLDDILFYKVIFDYKSAILRAKDYLKSEKVYILVDNIINEELRQYFYDEFVDVIEVDRNFSVEKFIDRLNGKKCIVIGDILGSKMERYLSKDDFCVIHFSDDDILENDTKKIKLSLEKLAKKSVLLMEDLINLDNIDFCQKIIKIDID